MNNSVQVERAAAKKKKIGKDMTGKISVMAYTLNPDSV